jgi:hypothetical protein
MKMLNNLLGCFLILLLLAGCKTNKQIATVSSPVTKAAAADFFDAILKQSYNFNTLAARTNMEFKTPRQEISSRVDIKMIKDTVILLSLQPMLGIEAVRMEFSRDSVKMIDRINKQCLLESYISLKEQTKVDFNFYNLQALFSNHIFVPGMAAINPSLYSRFKITNEGRLSKVQINDAAQMLYTFVSERGEKLLSTDIDDASTQYNLKWQYSDFKASDGQTFPMQMIMQLAGKGETALAVKISFARLQRNIPVTREFAIPKNYKRVNFPDLIKSIGVK